MSDFQAGGHEFHTLTEAHLDRLRKSFEASDDAPERFVRELELASENLEVAAADRSYRNTFTHAYRDLFPGLGKCYRTEVLGACEAQEEQIWVNGNAHKFPRSTLQAAKVMQLRIWRLHKCLYFWPAKAPSIVCSSEKVRHLRKLLQDLDIAWAQFECEYIAKLIHIEKEERKIINTVKFMEHLLQTSEFSANSCPVTDTSLSTKKSKCGQLIEHMQACMRPGPVPEVGGVGSPCLSKPGSSSPCARYRQASGEFFMAASQSSSSAASKAVTCHSDIKRLAESCSDVGQRGKLARLLAMHVAHLNSCANVQVRGRQRMSFDVLEAAAHFFLGSTISKRMSSTAAAACRRLACHVLHAFVELRNYLSNLDADFVDPQLSNNEKLVQRLTALEEPWEIGARFLLVPDLASALCEVAALIANAQCFSPKLRSMLQDQDAELFLVLPRLVLLCTLQEPMLAHLAAGFLPHHFSTWEGADMFASSEIARLASQFDELKNSLTISDHLSKPLSLVWELVVEAAISGPGSSELPSGAQEFISKLEGFSMELQRREPEDWNRCCSVLLQGVEAASFSAGTLNNCTVNSL
eukprot:TRINITY_DN90876_c0_g1_i1.p1 TRINITY_DN90876_c0_g1~~TRINITY_DN90876_c0_g1_i1.p1  ORF type:complete len:581 (-),score=138.36 TRINITY_DN90876_c0_g1_i1:122-1864(-)